VAFVTPQNPRISAEFKPVWMAAKKCSPTSGSTSDEASESPSTWSALCLKRNLSCPDDLKGLQLYGPGEKTADRKWGLDIYAECIQVVQGGRVAKEYKNGPRT
jgi:hypothetical protein